MLLQEAVKSFLLTNGKLTGLDTGVIDTKERVNIVHRLSTDVSELLNLGSSILDLEVQHGCQ